MLSLLRSDVYRLVHGKALWVTTVVLVACMVISAGLLNMASQPNMLLLYAEAESATVEEVQRDMAYEGSPAGFVAATDQDAGADGADGENAVPDAAAKIYEEVGRASDDTGLALKVDSASALTAEDFAEVSAEMHRFSSPTALFASTFVSAGLLFLVTSLMVALLFSADFDTRFIRNLPADRRGRSAYYGEKLLLAALVALYFLVVLVVSCVAAFAAWGFSYEVLDGPGELVLWLLLTWLLTVVYAWLTALTVWLTRSKAAAIAESVLVSTTMIGAFLSQLLGYFGTAMPWLRAVVFWLPSSTLGGIAQSAASLMEPGAVGSVGVSALVVLLVWLAACAALALTVCKRRDA